MVINQGPQRQEISVLGDFHLSDLHDGLKIGAPPRIIDAQNYSEDYEDGWKKIPSPVDLQDPHNTEKAAEQSSTLKSINHEQLAKLINRRTAGTIDSKPAATIDYNLKSIKNT